MRNEKSPGAGSVKKSIRQVLSGAAVLGLVLIPIAFASASNHPGDETRTRFDAPFDQEHLKVQESGQVEKKTPQPPADAHGTAEKDPHAAADQHAVDTHEGGHESHGDSGFLSKLVNFVVLFGGLTFLLRKPISKMLGQRADDIRTSMTEAEESNKTAQTKLAQGQGRLDEMALDVKRISNEAEEAGRLEKEEIMDAAKRDVERIRKLAAQEIALLSQVGVKELKSHAAEMASSLARENLLKRIKASDHASLIDKSIDRLEAHYKEKSAQ